MPDEHAARIAFLRQAIEHLDDKSKADLKFALYGSSFFITVSLVPYAELAYASLLVSAIDLWYFISWGNDQLRLAQHRGELKALEGPFGLEAREEATRTSVSSGCFTTAPRPWCSRFLPPGSRLTGAQSRSRPGARRTSPSYVLSLLPSPPYSSPARAAGSRGSDALSSEQRRAGARALRLQRYARSPLQRVQEIHS